MADHATRDLLLEIMIERDELKTQVAKLQGKIASLEDALAEAEATVELRDEELWEMEEAMKQYEAYAIRMAKELGQLRKSR